MSRQGVSIVVPVLNGGGLWRRCAEAIVRQVGVDFRVMVIDSGSVDGSAELAADFGFEVLVIDAADFDHGGTRQRAANLLNRSEIIVYLTQDAVLDNPSAVATLVSSFDNPQVGMAYGRQLPREGSGAIEAHARFFNYPRDSRTKWLADKAQLGMKVAFASNSFSAYRADALFAVGGFPNNLILAEDVIVAARMLKAGFAVEYVGNACARHSHAYSVSQEFKRYFDIGVFHFDQSWVLDEFGRPEGEGLRFLCSEMRYLMRRAPFLIPEAILRTIAKFLGYKLGRRYVRFAVHTRKKMSMHYRYWDKAVGSRFDL